MKEKEKKDSAFVDIRAILMNSKSSANWRKWLSANEIIAEKYRDAECWGKSDWKRRLYGIYHLSGKIL